MNTIISFGLCPFVQRSLITMNYKKVPYKVEYIDLENKPDWFLKLSPLGKVPILKVGEDVLFESAVINEYIDETNGESLHPIDSFKKAQERAYIELSSVTIMNYFHAVSAKTQEAYKPHKESFEKNLTRLLEKYQGPFFRGSEFSLVDTSVIPIFHRLFLSSEFVNDLKLSTKNQDQLNSWSAQTLKMEEVKNSVPKTFEEDYHSYLTRKESYIHLRR